MADGSMHKYILTYDSLINGNMYVSLMFSFTITPQEMSRVGAQPNTTKREWYKKKRRFVCER